MSIDKTLDAYADADSESLRELGNMIGIPCYLLAGIERPAERVNAMADDAKDKVSPEYVARQTIDNLTAGRLTTRTVKDLGEAVDKAKSNSAVSKAIRLMESSPGFARKTPYRNLFD